MSDRRGEYEETAELHELFMAEPWRRLHPWLAATFGALPASATLVDVGAGSGAGLVMLAAASRAQLIAIEPSTTMRAMLVARILEHGGGADPDALRHRVTVVPDGVPAALARVPDEIDGFVAMHMLGHLSLDRRAATLRELALRTRPGGVGLVTVAQADPSEHPRAVRESTTLGAYRYDVEWRPDGASRYEVHAGDRLLRTLTSRTEFRTVLTGDLECDLGDVCTVEELAPGLVRLRRAA